MNWDTYCFDDEYRREQDEIMVEGMREVYIQVVEQAEEEEEKNDEGSGHVGAELTHPAYFFLIYVISDERYRARKSWCLRCQVHCG